MLDSQEQDSDSPLSFTGPQGKKRNNVCLIHTECLFYSHRSSEGITRPGLIRMSMIVMSLAIVFV